MPDAPAPEVARTRARRRLIGAVVLLGIGVIAFPLLFETEPRPIPVDLPIEIPKRESAPPLAMPAASAPAVSPPAAASTPPRQAAARPPVVAETPAEPAVAASAPTKAASVPAKAAADPKSADGARAQALLEGKPAASAPAAARYVVQIGAFAEEKTVREVRAKAAKAGLDTFTQTVSVAAGTRTRVRIGPFAKREEAEAAAAKAGKAGLPASIVKL